MSRTSSAYPEITESGERSSWETFCDDFFPEDIDSRECLAEKSDRFREFAELIMTFYIGAGGKVVRGELIDRVLDREGRLCEIPGADGRGGPAAAIVKRMVRRMSW